ncbi:mechanosensitive ion channel family protein [Glaciimonas immobilis]|uniref:Small-conductance mechanosensitive channel n=1 Tax=Glaciimonas immobilis TaxID=728004 RepID=A0A840RSX7_9BURK|nr:mechanosensitive ion channel domain-containing protein [Glaciimonas immobilis]KAF3996798.1 mechanosensitive ion channel [Glaciimonas immobilis]MBB5199660.1 small-conductance mechanosensitive channel [Glaciimonas immobilis]
MNTFAIDQLRTLWTFLATSSLHYAVNALLAIIILMLGWWFSSKLSRAFERLMIRSKVDATLRPVLRSVLLWLIRLITVIAVLGQFGVQTASIIAVLGAASLAIGLALQGTLQNIAAGMMLLFLRPFQVGEYIANSNAEGTVNEIGLFATKLTKADGVCLFVPNNQLWNSAVTNFSRHDRRRMDLPIGIDYKNDPAIAIRALTDMLEADARILKTPAPLVVVSDHAESAVMLKIRFWTMTSDYWAVCWDINQRIKPTLDTIGFSIPFPVQELRRENKAHQSSLPLPDPASSKGSLGSTPQPTSGTVN